MSDTNTISKNANILFQEKFFPSPARSVSFFLLDQVGLHNLSLIIVELLPYIKRVSKQDWDPHFTSSNDGEGEGFYPHVPFYLCLNLLSSLIVHMTKKKSTMQIGYLAS